MNRFSLMCAASALVLCAAANADPAAAGTNDVETVVVSGSPLVDSADDTASLISRVTSDQITQTGSVSLVDALASLPGVTGSSFAVGANRPVIRGFASNRVKMMEDGISSFDVSDVGPDHGVPISPVAAEGVEVVRGAATLRFGSQAIGGVVNTIDNRVPDHLPDAFSAKAQVTGGTGSNLVQYGAAADGAVGHFALHVDGSYHNAADYDTPEGKQANSFFRGTDFSMGSSYFWGNSHVGAAWVQDDNVYGIPGDDSHIVMRQTKFLGKASLSEDYGKLKTLNISGGYADYSHEEIEDTGEVATTFHNKEFDIRAEQLVGAIGALSGTALGFEASDRDYSAVGEDSSYLYPSVTTSFAGYVFTEAPINKALKLQFSGRIEHVEVTGTPSDDVYRDRNFTPVSGAVSAVWDVSQGLRLGLTVSSAARAPAQTELFARGGHDGPETYETGDPDLKVERSNSIEGTFRYNTGPVSFKGSVWASKFDNFIYGAKTGRTCDDDGVCVEGNSEELSELNYKQTGAFYRGFELQMSALLADLSAGKLYGNMQEDMVQANFTSHAGSVPRIPPFHLGGGLTWKASNYEVGFLALFAGRQDHHGRYDTATGSYFDLSAHASIQPFPETHPGLTFSISGTNLADVVERNAVAFNKDDVMMPGRDVRFTLSEKL